MNPATPVSAVMMTVSSMVIYIQIGSYATQNSSGAKLTTSSCFEPPSRTLHPSLTPVLSATCSVDVTYQVVVSNNSTIDTLTVDKLTDDKFGDITTMHDDVISTTCKTGGTIATSGNYTCSFVGRITSNSCDFTHTDTVTGDVTDDDNVSSSPSDSATVTVSTTGLTQ